MDQSAKELIGELCSRAGAAMEKVSFLALTISSKSEEQLQNDIDQLQRALCEINAMVAAAQSLLTSTLDD